MIIHNCEIYCYLLIKIDINKNIEYSNLKYE